MLVRLLTLAPLVATAAWSQGLVFEQLPATQRLGGRSGAVTVERRDGATPITAGNTQVTISADSPLAQVAAAPEPWAAWAATLQLTISPGSSRTPVFYVRDGRPGSTTWVASATGFSAADAGLLVRTDAITCDVETGTLLDTDAPPGCFNTRYAPYPASTITASAAAAHRGSFGVRLVDAEAGVGDAADTAVYDDGAPCFGDFFARSWVRLTGTSTVGQLILAQLTNAQADSPSIVDLRVDGVSGLLSLGGFTADAGYLTSVGDAGLLAGQWHLLEWAASGVGDADGGRRLWLDGRLVVDDQHVDLSGGRLSVARVAIGEPYSPDRRWLGTVDFDDVRSAAVPLASALRLGPAPAASVGDCVAVDLELVSSATGQPTPGLEPFEVALDAGATLYVDGACATPGAVLRFAANEARRTFSLRPQRAGETLQASTVDFLGDERRYAFSPAADAGADGGSLDAGQPEAGVEDAGHSDAGPVDGGAPVHPGADDGGAGDPRNAQVGCGCSATPPVAVLLAALALLRARRRAR